MKVLIGLFVAYFAIALLVCHLKYYKWRKRHEKGNT